MKPGRGLDALVAEKVMGLSVIEPIREFYCHPEMVTQEIPHYSTDYAAALEVRDTVAEWKFSDRLKFKKALSEVISARLGVTPDELIHSDEIIFRFQPSDICLAALKAVGVEV